MLFTILPCLLGAQGVTSAAIEGRVTRSEDGSPMADATVRVMNLSTGNTWTFTTRSTGRFLFEDVPIGGPYRIESRALGFTPDIRGGIMLALGQRLVANFHLKATAVMLAGVAVNGDAARTLNSARAGSGKTILSAQIAQLPNIGRDFLAVTALSPQTGASPSSGSAPTGGITIDGQNRLYNSFQIDGGINGDLYRGRLPGRETLVRPIALDAVSEIQVLAAPFDVRQGAFAGGLVSAITRSGTNEVHGSLYGFNAESRLVGRGATGEPLGSFRNRELGGTLSGPIVRDRAHYFVSIDYVQKSVPDPGPLVTDTAGGADTLRTGLSYASAVRFQDILRNRYGLEPGTLGPVTGHLRNTDILGKVTIQLSANSQLEASHHFTSGDRWAFIDRVRGTYFLSGSGQQNPSLVNASRLIWSALVGSRWSNELIASRLGLDDTCRPNANYPVIRAGGIASNQLVDGAGGSCPVTPTNSVSQTALELTDNVSTALGSHVVTLGTHLEALTFRDDWLQVASGMWNFANLDSLASGGAARYERTIPGPGRDGPLRFHSSQVGLYAQDRWSSSDRLSVTIGIRADEPFLPRVLTRDSLAPSLAANGGRLPATRPIWSPRLAISYAPFENARTVLRGGVGLFSGPPPYGWLANAYRDDGTRELSLICSGQQAPRFDPRNQPTACADGTGPKPRLSFFDRDVHSPQNWRISLGADHQLTSIVEATIDALYTRSVHQLYATEANLLGPVGVARGEGGRVLYGSITATPTSFKATPALREASLGSVIHISDRRGDDALSLSAQVRAHLGSHLEASAFYAFTEARDRMSLINPLARQNLENTVLDGTLEDRSLRTSYFEIPHRVLLDGTTTLPFQTSLTLLYSGASGTPYSYVVQGDVNADGIPPTFSNDLAYVPRDSADISLSTPSQWNTLERYIEREPCLRRQRGRILARNSCRNPWFGTVSAKVTKALPLSPGQSLEMIADIYNVLNMLNNRWGQSYLTIQDPWVRLLTVRGYDVNRGRGVYDITLPDLRHTLNLASRWQMELGLRYVL
ncbi:MAG TPA: carboxypeptidase regulatory-like domain-containing protein [Gemmatimonadaceae bacterium]|nr:carboxypeptidase regulatory-like domain-containing protein [Gemmatimonadaceae bacterium]